MKKFLSMALALAMTLSLVVVGASAKDFTDKSKITYGEAVDVVSTCKIIDGYTDGSFNPSATLTRGAAAKIICNMVLGPTTAAALGVSTAPFKDVSVSNVFAGYIAYCAKQGIINGYADKTFRPSGTVTGYQFLKMLLGALGYDASIEGYTGANWEVNVAKQASNLKLTSGNSKFTGSAAMTREEACLYAYNTLCTTLVEYADKGQTITVNGVTITQSASKPSVVTSTVAKEQRISTKKVTNSNAYTVEFGERYFPNLVLTSDNDAFMRPTEVWYYGSKLIGSYAIDADKTYTTKTTLGTIYTDLGLTSKLAAADVTVYRDGVKEASFSADITKGSDTKLLGTGTGVKTDLFYSTWYDDASSSVKRSLTICEMNTYVGDVTSKVAKTAAKDAYVTVAARTDDAKSQAYPSGNFETENFAVNDVVLYNYSKKTGSVGIQDMTAAKTATGKLTAFTSGDKCTIGGTTYNYTATVAREATSAAANTDVTVVLDTYGNAIDVVGKTSTQYAYVLNWSATNGLYGDGTLAKLLTDGTVVDATLTTAAGASNGAFVTYTVNGDGKYTLSPLAQTTADTTSALAVDVKNGDYTIDKVAGVTDLTANGNTIFLVATTDAAGNAVYNAYNGIKNVPTMALTAGATAVHSVAYCKAGKLATVVFVDATKASSTSISNPSSDQIFVKAPTTTTLSYTYGVGNYYKYDAVVNGTAKTGDDGVMVGAASRVAAGDAKSALNAAGNTAYGLFDSNNKDSKNVYSLGVSNSVVFGTGAYKQANDVIGTLDVTAVGGDTTGHTPSHTDYAFYNVATGATMTVVDVDGNIVTGQAASAIINDSNDLVWFKLNASNEITAIYVVKVANGEFTTLSNNVTGGNEATTGYKFSTDNSSYATTLSNVMYGTKVYVKANTADYKITSSLPDWTEVTAAAAGTQGVYSFTMPVAGVTAADFTVAQLTYAITPANVSPAVKGVTATVTADKATAVSGTKVTVTVVLNGTVAAGGATVTTTGTWMETIPVLTGATRTSSTVLTIAENTVLTNYTVTYTYTTTAATSAPTVTIA